MNTNVAGDPFGQHQQQSVDDEQQKAEREEDERKRKQFHDPADDKVNECENQPDDRHGEHLLVERDPARADVHVVAHN